MEKQDTCLQTTCCIAGGGPAGMMLGYLLSRAGVEVIVLEKHADFLRDFRGDTLHPSTLELMRELDLLDDLLKVPHEKISKVGGKINGEDFVAADFSHLPVHSKFIAIMPQWDFLNFLAEKARAFPQFHLYMESAAESLLRENGRVVGLIANGPRGPVEVRADLIVAADGRHSTLRQESGLEVIDLGAPIDVLWMRLSRRDDDVDIGMGHFRNGRMLVLIPRADYFQCGLIIAKGGADEIKRAGLAAFQQLIAGIAPRLRDRVHELDSWDKVKLLSVQINRLKEWHQPGLLLIGDAAHAMSPMGGVGINLAIQDAVAAANLLAAPLLEHHVTERLLERVQMRREWPTRVTQAAQVFAQKRVFQTLSGKNDVDAKPPSLPLALRLFPPSWLQGFMGRMIGMGARPEHIRTPRANPVHA